MLPEAKCGREYSIGGHIAPKRARFALWIWGYVRYYQTEKAANRAFDKLSDYEKRGASIDRINRD